MGARQDVCELLIIEVFHNSFYTRRWDYVIITLVSNLKGVSYEVLSL